MMEGCLRGIDSIAKRVHSNNVHKSVGSSLKPSRPRRKLRALSGSASMSALSMMAKRNGIVKIMYPPENLCDAPFLKEADLVRVLQRGTVNGASPSASDSSGVSSDGVDVEIGTEKEKHKHKGKYGQWIHVPLRKFEKDLWLDCRKYEDQLIWDTVCGRKGVKVGSIPELLKEESDVHSCGWYSVAGIRERMFPRISRLAWDVQRQFYPPRKIMREIRQCIWHPSANINRSEFTCPEASVHACMDCSNARSHRVAVCTQGGVYYIEIHERRGVAIGRSDRMYQVGEFSADGSTLLVGNSCGELEVYDVNGSIQHIPSSMIGFSGPIKSLAMHTSNPSIFAACGGECDLRVGRVMPDGSTETSDRPAEEISGQQVDCMAFGSGSSDDLLLCGILRGIGGELRAFDLSRGKSCWHIEGHEGMVSWIASSSSGSPMKGLFVSSGDEDLRVKLWDVRSSRRRAIANLLHSQDLKSDINIQFVALGEKNPYILSCGSDNRCCVWDFRFPNSATMILEGIHSNDKRTGDHDGGVMHAAFSSDEELLFSASDNGTVGVWSVARNASVRFIEPVKDCYIPIERVLVSSDDTYVVCIGDNGTVALMSPSSGIALPSTCERRMTSMI
eukprot:TRINITY_DN26322_c0_g1_i1.p1 TRINITY_DN26322_c0_g1~~TRINITY_DN26322_c0_g1_i1.p1  ORF type:complete len:617 (+),score=122.25 TRINITY_DN26322_c0_g1_i1:25-1875(+)